MLGVGWRSTYERGWRLREKKRERKRERERERSLGMR
jgi:hypothetical protein